VPARAALRPRAAGADHAADRGHAREQKGDECLRHRPYRAAALAAEYRLHAARMRRRDFGVRDIAAARRGRRGRDVDRHHGYALVADAGGDESQLLALGVEAADDVGRTTVVWRCHRKLASVSRRNG
jgi:hypothetical protein